MSYQIRVTKDGREQSIRHGSEETLEDAFAEVHEMNEIAEHFGNDLVYFVTEVEE